MVLRQLPAADNDAHGKQVLESVDMARQAVQLDVKDGTSWCEWRQTVLFVRDAKDCWDINSCCSAFVFTDILGNAYVSLFFTCGQNPQLSQQALSAYTQSVSTDTNSYTPEGISINNKINNQHGHLYFIPVFPLCRRRWIELPLVTRSCISTDPRCSSTRRCTGLRSLATVERPSSTPAGRSHQRERSSCWNI